jgi:predicted enzyme related to lactoylglutathione lyase
VTGEAERKSPPLDFRQEDGSHGRVAKEDDAAGGIDAAGAAMDVPKVGRIAVLRDPQWATFGILKPDPSSM